ncbi:deleted in malignant brain tumors 1 protein-like isoform X2 [Xyrichtys novacula]|uniref:Deleted in malignant brain tumors 1 protein-like isoform X2 n=1 Tax=Xyrichtys novacula TaxID=13765 RepID=A0AAV1G1L9_XYRNO|nr:deleted in malignant brain tumors 1 protein-like isoform X2 [Xyrichtys novacula]
MWTLWVLCGVVISCTVQGEVRLQKNEKRYLTTYPAQLSCRYNCGRHLGSCSCSSSCQYYGNCCYDYDSYCQYTTTPPEPETTAQPSCRYNCGYNMGSCSCSSSCEWSGNCCHDYYSYCQYTPTPPAPETTAQPSCRHNCGYNMGSCSCSSSCEWSGNCCHDYYYHCPYYTTPSGDIPTTSQPSCRYNCGYNMGSCSCSSSCEWSGNCCHDYYCKYPAAKPLQTFFTNYDSYSNNSMSLTTYLCHAAYCQYTPTPPAPETTAQPSCRYNCGYNMGSCSCSSSCEWRGNCCHDYYCNYGSNLMSLTTYLCLAAYCQYTSAPPAPETTAQPSCRHYCGSHMGSCSCSSSCRWNGNCCHDYYSYCQYNTESPTREPTTVNPCGGSLSSSGTFQSPNHPNHYHDNADCVWYLSAANNHRVFLSFTYMQLENCCSCDYISVYDGSYVGSRLLGKMCNDSQNTFVSSSRYMTVHFKTDSSVVGRGFSADFSSTLSPSSGQVICSSNMTIVIQHSYLSSLGHDGNNLYLNDPTCRPQLTRYQVIFSYSIDSCGNVRKLENGRAVYTNLIQSYNTTTGEITRQSHFKLKVECRMEQDSVSEIMYLAHSDNSSMTGKGRFNTSMDFYTSSNFYYKVTQVPYKVTLNQNLYVQVDLQSQRHNMVLFLDTCVTSPSPHDFQTRAYYLVRNGCPVDNTYSVYTSGSYKYARFTFKAFQFLRASESVYIQCKVRVCEAYNNSRCRPTGCHRRIARDLRSKHNSQTLVLGPIQLKESDEGESETQKQDKA